MISDLVIIDIESMMKILSSSGDEVVFSKTFFVL